MSTDMKKRLVTLFLIELEIKKPVDPSWIKVLFF